MTLITTDLDLALREATALYDLQQIFILVDSNTQKLCLPKVLETLPLLPDHILCLPISEAQKDLTSVQQLWDMFLEKGVTRASLLLILGGGVLTDLGGFAAATFKRGLPFINLPTTLLGAVDAATGGKTGFNYRGLKNEIGLFCAPERTIVCPAFWATLPFAQILSGYAEMLKHALIASPLELSQILAFDLEKLDFEPLAHLLERSLDIKNYIVELDPTEKDIRRTLNFGHTIGHALESYSFTTSTPLLHGYAVMYGMVAELYLSVKRLQFPEKTLTQVTHFMLQYYGKPTCPCRDYDKLIALMRHDKKNDTPEHIQFTLLRAVGNYQLNEQVAEQEIADALDFLFNL